MSISINSSYPKLFDRLRVTQMSIKVLLTVKSISISISISIGNYSVSSSNLLVVSVPSNFTDSPGTALRIHTIQLIILRNKI